MNDAEVAASIAQAREWSEQELMAYANAFSWLSQAQSGEIPHGDATCLHYAQPARNVTTDALLTLLETSPAVDNTP